MAAATTQNAPVQGESKSAAKKRAKAAAAAAAQRTESPAPSASERAADAGDDAGETAFTRELQKSIRNLNKKITNMAKTETVIAEHPGKSLDELLAGKLINADQKAQISKKPTIQAEITRLEEQLAQIKKMEAEHKAHIEVLKKSLAEKYENEKAKAVREAEEKAHDNEDKVLHDGLLAVSQFLRLAAARRAEEADQTLDENLALEGVLLGVYCGDEAAVDCMTKLVKGSEDQTLTVNGDVLKTTYAQIKTAAEAFAQLCLPDTTAAQAEETQDTTDISSTDPTLANASLTEIKAGADIPLTNGHADEDDAASSPINTNVNNSAANASGDKWDSANDMSGSGLSQEWVNIPSAEPSSQPDANPTTAPASGVSAAANPPASLSQSWADEQPEPAGEVIQPAAQGDGGDGFHQVQGRQRGRGEREGGSQWRGRGRGDYRGRGGFRGEGRGRGRGGPRGGGGNNNGNRGYRRAPDES